jgi:multicomponent Na+:H+ antiporter subunit D
MSHYQFIPLIIIIPLLFSYITPLIGWWNKRLCYPWIIIALSSSLLSSLITLYWVMTHGTMHYHFGGWLPPWGIEYVVDHLNALMLVIVSSIGFLVAIYSKRSVEQEIPEKLACFYTVFLLEVTGLLGIVITGDMFNLYVFLEIASLSGYALIAIGEDGAAVASFRYIIMGTIGACFYLLGVGYLYISTGSLNMADLSKIIPPLYHSKAVLTAFAFFMVGVSIKMALFPLHMWLPEAYTRAPSATSALIAPLMTKVAVYVMIRIMFTVFRPYFSIEVLPVTTILSWIAVIAIVCGAVMALAQRDLKKMLCYLIVAEVGYMVGGIGLANRLGLTGTVLHILNDAVMTVSLFLIAGIVMLKVGERDIYQLRYLFRRMPITMGAFIIVALSMIGIPPTCGFFSKWYLILGAVEAQNWAFVVAILMSSLINAILFFRIIEVAYYVPAYSYAGGSQEKVPMDEAPLSMLIPTLITSVGIILIGIFAGKIVADIIRFAIPPGL